MALTCSLVALSSEASNNSDSDFVDDTDVFAVKQDEAKISKKALAVNYLASAKVGLGTPGVRQPGTTAHLRMIL